MTIDVPVAIIDSDYVVTGKVMFFPLNGRGMSTITLS